MSGVIMGSTEPRIHTKPLRPLTPETSYGYAVIDFAKDVLGEPLDPWQEWLVIHAGELLEDGRPRFRRVLVLVARQNGKTHLLKVLAQYWIFRAKQHLVLGTSTTMSQALESWDLAVEQAETTPTLAAEIDGRPRRNTMETYIKTTSGCRYSIRPATRRGARGLTVDRLIIDELREHRDWEGYNAAIHTMNARPNGQAWLISNQGDMRATVLRGLHKQAIEFIQTGEGNYRLGIFEWSAPEDCALDDVRSLAQANPNLGHRLELEDMLSDAKGIIASGDEEQETGFRTEVLCQYVPLLNPAVDSRSWTQCISVGTMEGLRDRVMLCLDVSPDGHHVTLVAGAMLPDERIRLEVVDSWEAVNAIDQCRRSLFGIVPRVKPRYFGWLPGGPAAVMQADLMKRKGRVPWPPLGVKLVEIKADLPAVCMGFAEQVRSEKIVHSGDDLLTAHIAGAQKMKRGDLWVFSRRGGGHCDAAYAAAGVVHMCRTLTARKSELRLISA